MIGRTKSAKSRLSTSTRETSKTSNSTTYQQLESRNLLATFVVTTTDDIVADDGLVSLREAITAANTNLPYSDVEAGSETGDRIVFAPDVRAQRFVLNEELQILDDLVVRGFETEGLDTRLSGNGNRVFDINTTERVYFRDIELRFGSAEEGGLVKVSPGGNVTFKDSSILSGNATRGGGIHATDSRIVFDETRADSNLATETGGAVWASGGELLIINGSGLSNGNASEGGAVFVDGGTRFLATDSNFVQNRVTGQGGGAIWAGEGTNIEIRGGSFTSNGQSSDADPDTRSAGGAIRSIGDVLRVRGTSFTLNNAFDGGAISSGASTSSFVETVFEENAATRNGGALWFSSDSVRILNSTISENTAADLGGGLHFSGSNATEHVSVIKGTTISSNTARIGGGVSTRQGELRIIDTTVSNNTGESRGGGVEATFGNLLVLNSTFESNEVTTSSGGGGALSNFQATTFIQNSTFRMNSSRLGGAISGLSAGDITVRSSSFESNTADAGGAIGVGGNSTIRTIESTFESNTANNSGGAVFIVGSGRFVARQNSFLLNTARSGEGGAIANFGTANISASTFDSNSAQRGAAIKVGGARALLSVSEESTFKSNVAAKNGAAISSTTSSVTLIDNASFMDNVVEDGFGDILFADEVAFHRVTNSNFQ